MIYFKAIPFILINLMAVHAAGGQFIYEIIAYQPAPGQHINGPAGTPEAARSIIGTANGLVSLGAFGGSITFRFENPVANHPDHPYGIDFTIFGNSFGNWSEPGIVSVMKDANRNGLADDTWYELAGSEYHTGNTDTGYKVTYRNPGKETAADVSWTDNRGNSGFVFANASHTQPYYPKPELFPGIGQSECSLEGTRIIAEIDSSDNRVIQSPVLAYGYADNHMRGNPPYTVPDNPFTPDTEGAGGDPMDISWAVDHEGLPVVLDTIHFIRVHTAVNGHAGALGEISTEITGAAMVSLVSADNPQNHDPGADHQYSVYPNPAGERLLIQGKNPGHLTITGPAGQTILATEYSGAGATLDIPNIPGGIYILRIANETSVYSKIIVKR